MLAIIPARGGSKGIPKKNLYKINNKPLIAYTIEQAKKSKKISKIILSTDDNEIMKIGKKYNIEIPFLRPKYLSSDKALAIDNYIYTIKKYSKLRKTKFENFIVLLPTSPLRTSKDIDDSIELFNKTKADSVISCKKLKSPITWILDQKKNGRIKPIIKTNTKKMMNRQSTKLNLLPNGSIYIFNTEFLIKNYSYYGKKTYSFIMPENRSIDIDSLNDIKLLKYFIKSK